MRSIIAWVLILSPMAASAEMTAVAPSPALPACSLQVVKSNIPLDGAFRHPSICVEDYFARRDMGRMSLGEDHRSGAPVIWRDTVRMTFNDAMLVDLSPAAAEALGNPIGEQGRREILESLYERAYLPNFRSDQGTCRLEMKSGERVLGLADFTMTARTALDQPGNRLSLASKDLEAPSWKLLCRADGGEEKVEKKGSYFFLNFDFYENTSPDALKHHLVQYLFAFR